ncbi:hypothetical protein F2Q69_00002296 [Brassica cretica]|uniref:Uncharacterized protein n=1 Tax=Brassica cretica TaxID=69181 RepID=A0A8S9P8A7_BRACR|nr:hypothetical protein F2Q69_00002296 [Brassica cretica]
MSSSDPIVAQSAFHCCASAPFLGLQKQQKHGEFMGITLFLLDEKVLRRLVLIDALRTAPSYSGDLKRTVTGFKSTPIFVVASCVGGISRRLGSSFRSMEGFRSLMHSYDQTKLQAGYTMWGHHTSEP